MDRLLNTTEEEQRFLRILLHYWKASQHQPPDAQWVSLIPMLSDGKMAFPIPVPAVAKPIPITSVAFPFGDGDEEESLSPSTLKETETPPAADSGASSDVDLGNNCREAILATFALENRRMTNGEIHIWLQDHGKDYSKEFVIKTLTQLRTDGEINNDTDRYGRGYGLTVWSQTSNGSEV